MLSYSRGSAADLLRQYSYVRYLCKESISVPCTHETLASGFGTALRLSCESCSGLRSQGRMPLCCRRTPLPPCSITLPTLLFLVLRLFCDALTSQHNLRVPTIRGLAAGCVSRLHIWS
ncbi:hypothetical protein PsYK624_158790 [Phanerochaete sordida]|uniref:Uncharacterized protein n=1 Tax=Phanerochaete sordida TaxID=48140 RepID=A0A9P3LME3_9APHY|nr:hypothetical protein PsYK624_158790 [Phanerochaete sordida]